MFASLGLYLLTHSFAATPPGTSSAATAYGLGFYRGAARPDKIAVTEAWLGRQVTRALDFYPGGSWSEMETNQGWQLKPWADSRYQMTLTIPMLPQDGTSSLAAGANGQYNAHWRTIAQNLVAANLGSVVLRIGHEFNGNWYAWSAANDPANWPVYWRQIVTTMRSVPGANFRYDWSVVNGYSAFEADTVYPGDAYVDIIGTDVYNQSWAPNYTDPAVRWNDIYNGHHGLAFWVNFASSHNKPLSIPEWGTGTRPDGHGGGDDPNFIQQMYNVITTSNIAYHNYWDYCASDFCGELSNGQFPVSGAKFKELFVPLLSNILTGDLDRDSRVTGHDLSLLLGVYNTTYPAYDLDGTAPITGHDLSLLLANYGR